MELFENYFTAVAVTHPDLLHDEAEGGNKSFFIIEDWDNPQDVLEAIGRQAGEHIMVLEDFEDHVSDNGYDNNTIGVSSAFAILKHVSDKRGDKKEAKNECRAIALGIIRKLKSDTMYGQLLGKNVVFKLDSKGFAVGPVMSGWYGWRYSFSWQEQL